MKALMMVFRASMAEELDEVLRKSGITAYTLIKDVEGKGVTGSVVGSFFYPGTNSLILAMLPSEQADKTISALKSHHDTRLQATHGQAIAFKLFSWSCDELI